MDCVLVEENGDSVRTRVFMADLHLTLQKFKARTFRYVMIFTLTHALDGY